ncbi:NAD(P)/FAD-dependent oxidoreductase [Zhihengliuella halotolerans]|uniref:NAD(P)/FAD-dependent oxidoreductase n=1 Tax=Zhihengliuella halotolerans TaxID=370736 RepID=UPI000C803501|nr:FAD-dependent oxidoreductase [Zhihengliuella halotolerans]
MDSVIVVGGGLGGFTVVQQLRGRGFAGTIAVVDPEGLPYDRPPLSKEFLAGGIDAEQLHFVEPHWFAERHVDVYAAAATAVDLPYPADDDGRVAVTLSDGGRLLADRVVFATGGRARTLPIPGGDLDSLLVLRTRADAEALRSSLRPGTRLALIGAGLIGAEAASVARGFGAEVTLIEPVDPPLVPAIGRELAERLHAMHAEAGIRVVTAAPTAIRATAGEYSIEFADGTVVSADVVLVGIGIEPETALAEASGLDVVGGILTDAGQRTSHPRAWAVGDCARPRHDDGSLGRRAEHWENAMHAGTAAAAAMLGQEPPAPTAPWFWSDRHGVHVEGVGDMSAGETTVTRADASGRVQAAFRLAPAGDGQRVVGAAAIDGGVAVRVARRLIDRGIAADPARLADPSVPYKQLLK